MKKNVSLTAGAVIVALFALMAIISLFYTPYDPDAMDLANRFASLSSEHPLGTDQFGRDLLSRVMMAGQVALSSALLSVTLGALLGILVGTIAALGPGFVDALLMRLVDALMSFPTILAALALSAILGKGLLPSVVAICLYMIPSFSRLTYSMILECRDHLYIKAAKSYAAPWWRIVVFHIFPSLFARLITQFTAAIGSAILLESSLSFLGLGIQPPSASLGMMLSEAKNYVLIEPWQVVPPGLVLLVMVLGFNLLGDGLADRMREGVKNV